MCDPPVSRAVSSDANDRDAGDAECAVGIGGDSDAAAAEAAAAAGLEPCVPLTPAELHSRGCGLVRLLEESSGGTGSPQAQQGVAAQRWVDADSAVRARALCELRVLAWAAPGAHRMDKLDVRPGAGANHPGYPEEHCFFLVFVERLGGDAAYGRTILLRDVCARVVRFCAAVRLFCTLLAAAHGAGCGILSDCTASKRRAARLAEKAAADMKKKEQKEGEEAAAADSRKEEEEGRASVSEGAQAESREEGSARTADGERGGGETSGDRRQPPCPGPHPLLYPVEQPLLVSSVYRVLDGVLHPQHLLVTDRRLVLRPTLSLEDLSAHGGGCGGPSSLEHLPLVNCNEAAVEIPATLISSLRLFQEKRDVAAAAATRVYARHRRQQQQQALLLRTKKKGSARSSPLSPRSSAPNLQDDGSSGGEEEEEEAAQTPHSLLLDEELLTASKRSEYLEVTCKNTWQVVLCFREPRDGYAAFSRLRKRPKGGEEGGGATRVKAVAAARPVVAPRPAPVAAASNVPAVLQRPPSLLSDAGSENPLLSASASPAAEPEAAAAAAKKAAATEPAAEYYLPRRLHPSPAAVPGRFSVARTTAGVLNAFLPKAYAQDSFFALAYARKLFFPLLRAAEVAAEAERFHVEELRRIVRGYEARNAAGRWRISEANKGFVLCKTMPEAVLVPAEFGDADVRELAGFRVGARFPMVSWVNPVTGACIVRASQPAVGIRNRRCSLDERLMASLCAGVPDGPKLSAAVMDARPFQNAVANLAKGGGYVSSRHYNGCSMVCANIGNIHTMRRSLDQLRKVLSQRSAGDKNWIKQVEDSEWSAHIERILQASLDVACMAGHGHKSVLVHCTNGWDRTSQLVAVANLLLDPHYRTLKGFLAVLDKDWLCGSHKFAERLGLGGNEKYRAKGISPVFLQFVEGVVQLVRKSPNAYEFNERFLLFLCVAPWSGKIGSFMVNTPKDRASMDRQTVTVVEYVLLGLREHAAASTEAAASASPSARSVADLERAAIGAEVASFVNPAFREDPAVLDSFKGRVGKVEFWADYHCGAEAALRAQLRAGSGAAGTRVAGGGGRDPALFTAMSLSSFSSAFSPLSFTHFSNAPFGSTASLPDAVKSPCDAAGGPPTGAAAAGSPASTMSDTRLLPACGWLPDALTTSCLLCQAPFTLTVRRHHCRQCGYVFCCGCAPKRASTGRTCDTCFKQDLTA